ncbi:MAG: ribosome maturation factor RimP [Deltaproteobacteria bacterium]|nr:ribosome maturation factor RimP [Deltaproteobacteria bacterium]
MSETSYSIARKITDLAEPILDETGYELVDVEYLSTHGKWVVRIYIDKAGGISIDDCVQVSRELGDLLDIKEIIEHEYVLEVSSPGVNRPLKKEKDFVRAIGQKIKVTTTTPINGRRHFLGRLEAFENGDLHLDINGTQVMLSWEEINKANIVYEFKG